MLNRKEISELFDIPYETLYFWKHPEAYKVGPTRPFRKNIYDFLEKQNANEILETLKKDKPVRKIADVLRFFDMPKSTFFDWKKNNRYQKLIEYLLKTETIRNTKKGE